MKYFKFLRFDLREGIWKKYKSYLALACLILIAFLDIQTKAEAVGNKLTLGEYMFCIYGGIKRYVPTMGDPFKVPYLWLLNHLLILYFTLNYTPTDLNGFGQQTIYRSGGRLTWWFSKCSWQIIASVMYYAVSWLCLGALTALNGISSSLEITPTVFIYVPPGSGMVPFDRLNLALELLLLPLLTTVSLGMLQLTLSIIIKPQVAYIASAAILIMSSHTQSPLLLGNYAMAVRSDRIITEGMNASAGIVSMIALSVICAALGALKFRKYDILCKEE